MSRRAFVLAGWTLALASAAVTAPTARADAADGGSDVAAASSSTATPVEAPGEEYHTPLAGKPLETTFLGRKISVEERERGQTVALTLGGLVLAPRVGSDRVLPEGALYVSQIRPDSERRLRAEIAGIDDEVEGSLGLAPLGLPIPGLEAAGHFENTTIPIASSETVSGVDLDGLAIEWGTVTGGAGLGWRRPVWPFEVDSSLRVTAYYDVGFLYTRAVHDTAYGTRLPPNTLVHGPRLRFQVDAIHRNLLELPHEGAAAGLDLVFQRRDRWRDHGLPGLLWAEKSDGRDTTTLAVYGVAAGGFPFLSERHRWILQGHAGTSPEGRLDRFSAFRIGGGPPLTEYGDLSRLCYPGASFDELLARDYGIASLEYRYEAFFFLYVHARATLLLARALRIDDARCRFEQVSGQSVSGALSSGFLFNSTIYAEYTLELGAARGGTRGSSVLVSWSKGF